MGTFVACHLQDDERESEFEDNLQGDETTEGVVVTLFGGSQEAGNKSDCHEPGGTGPSPPENSERDRFVDAHRVTHPIPRPAQLDNEPRSPFFHFTDLRRIRHARPGSPKSNLFDLRAVGEK